MSPRKSISELEAELKAAKEKEEYKKRERRYVEASKLTLFIIVGIVIGAFFIASFLVIFKSCACVVLIIKYSSNTFFYTNIPHFISIPVLLNICRGF